MKRFLALFLVVMYVCTIGPLTVGATSLSSEAVVPNEKIVSQTSEVLDGGYILSCIVKEQLPEETAVSVAASTYTKSGNTTISLKNKDGDVLFTFSVNGTFTVNPGVSATCTQSSYAYKIYSNSWRLESATATKNGNKAIADGKFICKLLFITTETHQSHAVLACDKNGVLSGG